MKLRWSTTYLLIAYLLSLPTYFYGQENGQNSDSICFIVIGDWGNYGNSNQQSVAKTMNDWASQNSVDFIISTGDNFYSEGVKSVDDPLWDKSYQQVYNLPYIKDLEWYVVLGNHDYQGDYKAQIDYSAVDKKWILPNNYYVGPAENRFLVENRCKNSI